MNRSFTARLARSTPRRLRDYLWATHRLFNESLAYLLKHYFWMQNLTDRDAEQDRKNQLRSRFASDVEQLDRLRLVYLDLMGLSGMGLPGEPKDKRRGRSQNAHAWMEQITFSRRSEGGDKSTLIHPRAKEAIRGIRAQQAWLFDRELAIPSSPDVGFRRSVMQVAARRILNFEQNDDTHRYYYEEAQRAFERWTGGQQREEAEQETSDTRRAGWRRSVLLRAWGKDQNAQREAEIEEISRLKWDDFCLAKKEFEVYERDRSEKRAREHGQQFDEKKTERLNGSMTRGWHDIYERLLPPSAKLAPDPQRARQIIADYQKTEPRRIGDINLGSLTKPRDRAGAWPMEYEYRGGYRDGQAATHG